MAERAIHKLIGRLVVQFACRIVLGQDAEPHINTFEMFNTGADMIVSNVKNLIFRLYWPICFFFL